MDLEMADHGIGDLTDHHGLEGAGNGDEDQDEHDADRDERGGQQRSSPVAEKIPDSDFE
jgi:hypothetical protein